MALLNLRIVYLIYNCMRNESPQPFYPLENNVVQFYQQHILSMMSSEWLAEYKDLSLDEESILPLPAQWLRSMKISLGEGGDSNNKTEIVYRNTDSGLESEEHPLLVKALNAAR